MLNTEFFKAERSELINKTFEWMTIDTKDNYQKVIKTTSVPYGPTDIEYKYNNFGFRCDDFEHWENVPYRILYAGCSMTEGIGLPLDDIWPKLLHKKICETYNIQMPFWTIAAGATGIDQMVRCFYNLKDLLRPQIVISYLPAFERRELWYETYWSTWSLDTKEGKDTKVFLNDNLITYQTEKNLAMLDLILKDIDSLFLFSSSVYGFQIKEHIDSPRFIQRPHIPEQYDVARDGLHAGPKTNMIMAEKAFDFFNPVIAERLGLTNI